MTISRTSPVGSVTPVATPRPAPVRVGEGAPLQVADAFHASGTTAPEIAPGLSGALRAAAGVEAGVAATLVGGPAAPAVDSAVRANAPDAAQKNVARHSQTFTTGRGFGQYVKMLDGPQPGGGKGPLGAAMEALRGKADARWLDAGGGEGYATRQVKDTEGYENLHVTVLSYESSAQPAPGYDVMTGRFVEDIPSEEFGKNDVITDVYGPLAYTGRPHEVLRKYAAALKPEGRIFAFLGSGLEHFGQINQVVTRSGQVLSFGEWLKTVPGLQTEVEKRPVLDLDGDPVSELWVARIGLDPEKPVEIPDLQTGWYEDGDPKKYHVVPRQLLVEAGAHGPSPAEASRLREEAAKAFAERTADQTTEKFLEAFRSGEFTNPLMRRLSSLKPGDEWVNVGPMARRVGEDLDGQHGIPFTDPDHLGISQWLMERRVEGIQRREFTYTASAEGADLQPGRNARLVTDYFGGLLSSYEPDKTLASYVGALREGGEAFVYLGLEKGGTGVGTRILTRDGRQVDLREWIGSLPGLEVKKYRGGTIRGEHFQQYLEENVFLRIRVDDPAAVRIPKLELLGTGGKSGDGAPLPLFREVAE